MTVSKVTLVKYYNGLSEIDLVSGEDAREIKVRGDGNCGPRSIIQGILLQGLIGGEQDKHLTDIFLRYLFKQQKTTMYAENLVDNTPAKDINDAAFEQFIQEYHAVTDQNFEQFTKKYFPYETPAEGYIAASSDKPIEFLAGCLRADMAQEIQTINSEYITRHKDDFILTGFMDVTDEPIREYLERKNVNLIIHAQDQESIMIGELSKKKEVLNVQIAYVGRVHYSLVLPHAAVEDSDQNKENVADNGQDKQDTRRALLSDINAGSTRLKPAKKPIGTAQEESKPAPRHQRNDTMHSILSGMSGRINISPPQERDSSSDGSEWEDERPQTTQLQEEKDAPSLIPERLGSPKPQKATVIAQPRPVVQPQLSQKEMLEEAKRKHELKQILSERSQILNYSSDEESNKGYSSDEDSEDEAHKTKPKAKATVTPPLFSLKDAQRQLSEKLVLRTSPPATAAAATSSVPVSEFKSAFTQFDDATREAQMLLDLFNQPDLSKHEIADIYEQYFDAALKSAKVASDFSLVMVGKIGSVLSTVDPSLEPAIMAICDIIKKYEEGIQSELSQPEPTRFEAYSQSDANSQVASEYDFAGFESEFLPYLTTLKSNLGSLSKEEKEIIRALELATDAMSISLRLYDDLHEAEEHSDSVAPKVRNRAATSESEDEELLIRKVTFAEPPRLPSVSSENFEETIDPQPVIIDDSRQDQIDRVMVHVKKAAVGMDTQESAEEISKVFFETDDQSENLKTIQYILKLLFAYAEQAKSMVVDIGNINTAKDLNAAILKNMEIVAAYVTFVLSAVMINESQGEPDEHTLQLIKDLQNPNELNVGVLDHKCNQISWLKPYSKTVAQILVDTHIIAAVMVELQGKISAVESTAPTQTQTAQAARRASTEEPKQGHDAQLMDVLNTLDEMQQNIKLETARANAYVISIDEHDLEFAQYARETLNSEILKVLIAIKTLANTLHDKGLEDKFEVLHNLIEDIQFKNTFQIQQFRLDARAALNAISHSENHSTLSDSMFLAIAATVEAAAVAMELEEKIHDVSLNGFDAATTTPGFDEYNSQDQESSDSEDEEVSLSDEEDDDELEPIERSASVQRTIRSASEAMKALGSNDLEDQILKRDEAIKAAKADVRMIKSEFVEGEDRSDTLSEIFSPLCDQILAIDFAKVVDSHQIIPILRALLKKLNADVNGRPKDSDSDDYVRAHQARVALDHDVKAAINALMLDSSIGPKLSRQARSRSASSANPQAGEIEESAGNITRTLEDLTNDVIKLVAELDLFKDTHKEVYIGPDLEGKIVEGQALSQMVTIYRDQIKKYINKENVEAANVETANGLLRLMPDSLEVEISEILKYFNENLQIQKIVKSNREDALREMAENSEANKDEVQRLIALELLPVGYDPNTNRPHLLRLARKAAVRKQSVNIAISQELDNRVLNTPNEVVNEIFALTKKLQQENANIRNILKKPKALNKNVRRNAIAAGEVYVETDNKARMALRFATDIMEVVSEIKDKDGQIISRYAAMKDVFNEIKELIKTNPLDKADEIANKLTEFRKVKGLNRLTPAMADLIQAIFEARQMALTLENEINKIEEAQNAKLTGERLPLAARILATLKGRPKQPRAVKVTDENADVNVAPAQDQSKPRQAGAKRFWPLSRNRTKQVDFNLQYAEPIKIPDSRRLSTASTGSSSSILTNDTREATSVGGSTTRENSQNFNAATPRSSVSSVAPVASLVVDRTVTSVNYDDFKQHVLDTYGVAANHTHYIAQERDASPNSDVIVAQKSNLVGVAPEKILTISNEPTPAIATKRTVAKCKIEKDKTYEGAKALLLSFKSFTEANKLEKNKSYEVEISDFNTPKKAEAFLKAYYEVFAQNATLSNKLKIKFKADGTKEQIGLALFTVFNESEYVDTERTFKRNALQSHFGPSPAELAQPQRRGIWRGKPPAIVHTDINASENPNLGNFNPKEFKKFSKPTQPTQPNRKRGR